MRARASSTGIRITAVAGIAAVALALSGCSGETSPLERAEANVELKQKAVDDAQTAFTDASAQFCGVAKDYVEALDRYGDVINDTAPTVGDVRDAGRDLAEPGEDAFAGAEAAVEAQQELVTAEQELADAEAELERVTSSSTAEPSESDAPAPSADPLAPEATVDRVEQAEEDFDAAQGSITDDTPLTEASEQFKSAVVALELAWMSLLVDSGCVSDEQIKQAEKAITSFVATVQQALKDAGFYDGAIDGIYGPQTTAAVEALQRANDLPATGTLDQATIEALGAELVAAGKAEAEDELVSTAALQQTLKLVGYWDGPVDGVWTDELTEALKDFQKALGVEPTGKVDAETIAAFEKALEDLQPEPAPTEEPSPEPSE